MWVRGEEKEDCLPSSAELEGPRESADPALGVHRRRPVCTWDAVAKGERQTTEYQVGEQDSRGDTWEPLQEAARRKPASGQGHD